MIFGRIAKQFQPMDWWCLAVCPSVCQCFSHLPKARVESCSAATTLALGRCVSVNLVNLCDKVLEFCNPAISSLRCKFPWTKTIVTCWIVLQTWLWVDCHTLNCYYCRHGCEWIVTHWIVIGDMVVSGLSHAELLLQTWLWVDCHTLIVIADMVVSGLSHTELLLQTWLWVDCHTLIVIADMVVSGLSHVELLLQTWLWVDCHTLNCYCRHGCEWIVTHWIVIADMVVSGLSHTELLLQTWLWVDCPSGTETFTPGRSPQCPWIWCPPWSHSRSGTCPRKCCSFELECTLVRWRSNAELSKIHTVNLVIFAVD